MALAVDCGLQALAGVLGPLQGVHGGHIRGLRQRLTALEQQQTPWEWSKGALRRWQKAGST